MHPTAFVDQFTAATRDAHTLIRTVADVDSARLTGEDPWITQQAAALITRLVTGRITPCPHIGTAPAMAQTAVWAADRLYCMACRIPDDPQGDVCDHCHQPSPDGLHTGIVTVGPVLLHYGRCGTCTPHP